jgi:hypothetical protein
VRRTRTTTLISCLAIAVISAVPAVCSQQALPVQQNLSNAELLSTILARMDQARQANQQQLRPYVMTREFKFYDSEQNAQEGANPKSHVIATVEYQPPNHKRFNIRESDGSRRGEYIVRHMLQDESEMAARNAPPPLTAKNYDFKLLGDEVLEGHPCWVLEVSPHHDERGTFRGTAWIDKTTFLTHRIRGQMAKNPSWWVKSVQVEINYGDAVGMWIPISTYAVADVRIFGKHVLTSRSVKLETEGQVVENFSSVMPKAAARTVAGAQSAYTGHSRPIPPILGSEIYVRK